MLITNVSLSGRAGTEMYVRDLAIGLLRSGHTPIVYSPRLGPVAAELRAATVPVVDDLAAVGVAPDVIHGQHHPEAMTALLHFPAVPALFLCHAWLYWIEAPPRFPRILRYVAVDDTCRDRLLFEHGIPAERVRVLLNAVDLERFRPRAPLPTRPRRALVYSNRAGPTTHLPAIEKACAWAGLDLDVIGEDSGRASEQPELELPAYDLVFAKARCALEAMAVGAAVVVCDAAGAGPLVTTENLARLRRLNFGIRTMSAPVEPELLLREIERYDAADAIEVSRRIRAGAGLDQLVDQLAMLYAEIIEEHAAAGPADPVAEGRAAAAYVRGLALAAEDNPLGERLRRFARRFPRLEKALFAVNRMARARGL